MTLHEGTVGKTYQVEKICIDSKIQRRLEAIGMVEQTKVAIVNEKRNGSMIIRLRGTRWAIGAAIASSIQVKEVAQ